MKLNHGNQVHVAKSTHSRPTPHHPLLPPHAPLPPPPAQRPIMPPCLPVSLPLSLPAALSLSYHSCSVRSTTQVFGYRQNGTVRTVEMEGGGAVVFPAKKLEHRVTKTTEGLRRARPNHPCPNPPACRAALLPARLLSGMRYVGLVRSRLDGHAHRCPQAPLSSGFGGQQWPRL